MFHHMATAAFPKSEMLTSRFVDGARPVQVAALAAAPTALAPRAFLVSHRRNGLGPNRCCLLVYVITVAAAIMTATPKRLAATCTATMSFGQDDVAENG
jgi:hypothetical protein